MRSNNFIEVVAVNRKSPTADDTTRATDSPGGTCYALDNAAAQGANASSPLAHYSTLEQSGILRTAGFPAAGTVWRWVAAEDLLQPGSVNALAPAATWLSQTSTHIFSRLSTNRTSKYATTTSLLIRCPKRPLILCTLA